MQEPRKYMVLLHATVITKIFSVHIVDRTHQTALRLLMEGKGYNAAR